MGGFQNYIIFFSIFSLIVVVLAVSVGCPIDRIKIHKKYINRAPPSQQPTQPQICWLSLFRSSFWNMINALAVLVGLSSSIVTIWGPFWRTSPIVEASAFTGTSSLDFPFIIENKSFVFGIHDQITCIIDLMYLKDTNGKVVILSDLQYRTRIDISPAKTIFYTCNPSRLFHVLPSGAMRIGTDLKFLDSPPGDLTRPFSVIKACIFIQIGQRPPFRFRWPLATNAPQWIDDSLVEGIPDTEPAPEIRPAHAYGARALVDASDRLLPTALRCWQPSPGHIDFS